MQNEATEKTYEFESTCLEVMGRPDVSPSAAFPEREKSGAITEKELEEYVSRIFWWAGFRDGSPNVSIDNRITKAGGRHYGHHSQHGQDAIVLGRAHAGLKTACHESAHSILYNVGRRSGHNREFRGLVMKIYDAFLPGFDLDRMEARRIAHDLGLHISWHVLPNPASAAPQNA